MPDPSFRMGAFGVFGGSLSVVLVSLFSFILLSGPFSAAADRTCSDLANEVVVGGLTHPGLERRLAIDAEELAERLESKVSPELSDVFRITFDEPKPGGVLTSNRNAYEGARFEVSRQPVGPVASVVRNVKFGYTKGQHPIGSGYLHYVAFDSSGQVVSVGGGSREVLHLFRTHLNGRHLTQAQKSAVKRANRKVFQALRTDSAAEMILADFQKARGWPEGLAQRNHLVAYPGSFDLRSWAQRNAVSMKDLILAGWIGVDFNERGLPRYFPRVRDAILIPFFDDTGVDIVSWRIRRLKPGTGPKYLSWPMDRSYDDPDLEPESLFNRWKLSQAERKKILLTEGEFKCMVSESKLGMLTLGLPGISQFSPAMAEMIRAAQPSEVIVMLDRDPRGKGYQNADGITDSQRAAYEISAMLQRQGLKVSVGQVPDVFLGSKAGIDDVLLKVSNGEALIRNAIAGAVAPREYARQLGISEPLMSLKYLKRRLARALEDVTINERRGAATFADAADVDRAAQVLSQVERLYRNLFEREFPGRKVFQSTWYRAQQFFTSGRLGFETQDKTHRIVPAAEDIAWLDFSARCPRGSGPSNLPQTCQIAEVRFDFPEDEYEIVENATSRGLLMPYLVIKRESGKAVAVVTFDPQDHLAGGTIPSVRRSRVSGSPANWTTPSRK